MTVTTRGKTSAPSYANISMVQWEESPLSSHSLFDLLTTFGEWTSMHELASLLQIQVTCSVEWNKTWNKKGPNYHLACELDQCILNFAHNTGILPLGIAMSNHCHFVIELTTPMLHCQRTVSQLMQQNWFGELRKAQLQLWKEANTAETPLSSHVTVGRSIN